MPLFNNHLKKNKETMKCGYSVFMSCHPLSATLVSSSRGHALATSAPFNSEMVMIIEFESVVDHENLGAA
jgi:hypothetical protein